MKRRYTAFMLALLMLAQVFAPEVARAKTSEPTKKTTVQLVKMGALDPKTYPKLDKKAILAIQKQARTNQSRFRTGRSGFFSVGSPYLPGQNPTDNEKAAAYGNLRVEFVTEGLKDKGEPKPFQWNEIFGTDSNGNPGTANIYFVQRDAKTNKEINTFKLTVDKAGKYSLKDLYGKPAKLPLYSKALEPYKYEVELETGVSEKITLLTMNLSNTGSETSSYTTDSEGNLVADIPLYLKIGQTASTKFVSKWNTNVQEAKRPKVVGGFNNKTADDYNYFPFPINDTDVLKIRREQFDLDKDEWPGYMPQTPIQLREVPKVTVDEDKLEDPETYTIDKNAKRITANDKVYKYDLEYDVINGGKLTMTEILPVTFDANGGKFASITDPNAEQKIKKEVDYDGTLTDKAEKPTKDRETFKGWSTTEDGKTPATDADFKNITKAKTFYAIWDNNAIAAEELTVHESFKADGATEYTNDFIPTLETLKGQVTIKDGNGDPQALANDDIFAIVDGSNEYKADGDDLKNYLYDKLKEEDTTEVSRKVTVKAKVTHANGTSQTVDIPIKVVKNIYEAKTLTDRPYYVPTDYVKVIVDPTTKAKDPQKTYYYVNPEAKVVIPGEDPTGTDGNQFTKWLIKGTKTEYKLSEHPRYQFSGETTIEAQYVSDVISPNEDGSKPDTVPKNYVEVKFVPTDKATDATKAEKIFWVNPEKKVTIPVANPVGKTYYTFKEWKVGVNAEGAVYKPNEAQKFEQATTITATYDESKNIIPYDPSAADPMVRPEGYVRVTFAADPGLKLTQQKAYYVKKNAGITLGNAELKKPGYEAETGYKFVKWDKEDALVIEASDIVVTAKAASIPDFVEKTNEHPNKPDDKYVTVTFKADNSGNGTVTEKTYFVNPNKYVTLTPPDDAKGNTGYEFGAWSQDAKIPTVYDKDTTITASFNETKAVIPNKNPDGSVNKQPPGYVTVTFEANKQGQIPADEITVYYVDPNRDVIINPPTAKGNTGYEFEKWDKKTTRKQRYDKDTTVTASFTKLDDIVDGSKPKPAGYVTVKFYKGDHGELSGQTVFYVNPEANPLKTIGDIKPTVTPETGWEFVGWPVPDKTKIDRNFDITAKYVGIPDVVPKDNPEGGENKIPDKYITVTFSTEENGKIKDTTNTKTKVVYVNPNKAVALDTFAPAVDPNTGFDFASWDTQIERAIQYKDKDVIKAKYNAKDDVIPQGKTGGSDKPAGYLTVTFDKGEHGTLSGKTVYYVKPNKEVTVPAPTVTPATGFKQKDGAEAWDKQLTQTFTKDTTIRAQYDSIKEVVPQKNTDGSDRPSGYKTVRFVGEHGTLAVDTVFYVNPEKVVDFTNTVNGFTKTPDFSYTDVGGTWSSEEFNKKFTDDTTFTFTFKKLGNVIPQKNPNGTTNDQPQGYVKVTLIPTAKATDDTKENKVFFVNPKETVEIKNKPQGKEITANGSKSSFKFIGWTVTRGSIASWPGEAISGKFIEETEITAKYEFTWINIVKEPIAEENIVTGKGDRPKPEDLIKNKYDKNNPTNTNNLPEGTTFTYEEEPKVDNVGNITAKVKVEYPGGATTIVEVPIKVVEHVVPQTGGESGSKPLVPASYVKVTVDTTDKAADNTKFVKVFWVKPNVEVKIPGILDPTGKLETDAKGVTLTNNFKKWKLEDSNPEITYDHGTDIKGIFTAKESKIVAIYGYGKNVDPQPNSGQWIPKGSVPSPKDFIKNPYNDDDPNNSNNLPPGTRFDFVPGSEPNTNQPGTNNSTSIKITYPNGETKTVDVTYNVTGDVVEQKDPNTKPVVPDEFVKVIVDKTQNAKLAAGESQTQVFWVNPTKTVTIPVDAPTANKEDMVFTEWDNQLTQQFTAKETTITAKFSKKQTPLPTAGYVITERGVQPKPDDYKKVITPPAGKTIKRVAVVTEPNVDKGGMTTARVSVTYEDNTTVQIPVQVFVQNKEQPYPTPQPDPIPQPYPTPQPNFVPYPVPGETKTVYKDRTVLRREVRYMQGFEGKFRPDDGLTRAEAAQILANALKEDGYPFDLRYKLPYKDTTKEMWYNDAVRITTQADVFIGYDDGEFKPQRKITRAEWIATLRRFQYVDKVGGNSLHMRKNHWAIPEVEAAYRSGWLSIYTEKKAPFNYDEPISRKEVAAVSNRAFRRVRDMAYIRRNDKFMTNYTDINRDMWAYDDILCASNTFLHQRQGAYIAYKRGDKAYTIDVKDAIIEQDLFQRIPRHR